MIMKAPLLEGFPHTLLFDFARHGAHLVLEQLHALLQLSHALEPSLLASGEQPLAKEGLVVYAVCVVK